MNMSRVRVILPALLAVARPLSAQCPDGTPPPCSSDAVSRRVPRNSVAVLTLENTTRDSNDAYLAEGLADQIATRLVQLPRLVVASRTRLRRFRESSASAAEIGRALNVAYLVGGSIRRSGTRLRITAYLERTRDGVQVWARSFEEAGSDLLAIEEVIATSAAQAIAGYLLPGERRLLSARTTSSPAAYDHFLRGLYLMQRRSLTTLPLAGREFEEALRLDPAMSEVQGSLALVYNHIYDREGSYRGLSGDTLRALARTTAARAVVVAPASAVAWTARGSTLLTIADSAEEARRALLRALSLDSMNAEALHTLAWAHLFAWRDSAAESAFHRALATEPDRPISLIGLHFVTAAQEQWEAARLWLDSAIRLDPSYSGAYDWRWRLRYARGDTAGARADAETARTLGGDPSFALDLLALASGESSALVRHLISPSGLATCDAAAYLSRLEEAFACLRRTTAFVWLVWRIRYDPYTRYRNHPLYQELVADARRQRIIAP